ncbi:hypothetical protein ALC53_08260, partial [Atta colombica]
QFPLYRLVLNSAENIPMFQCHTLSDIRKLLRCASLRYNVPQFILHTAKLIDFKEKETFSGSMSRKDFAINVQALSSNKRLRKKRIGSKSKESDNNLTINKIVRGNGQPSIMRSVITLVENKLYNRFMHQDNGLCQELHQNRTKVTTPLSTKTRNIFEI